MKQRILGSSLTVSEIGLGCMGMSEFYGSRDDKVSLETLAEAIDLGCDFFDTSDMYGEGHNERLIGTFLKQSGTRPKIATKFGIVREPGQYARRIDNSPEHIRKSCEASLQRLGVETIDLYYVHRLSQDVPVEETIGVLGELVAEGKIANIGLCEVSAKTLRRAHRVHPVAAVQTEYSLWTRDVEAEVLPTCRDLGIGFVPYSPLGRGFLTGQYRDKARFEEGDIRGMLPRFEQQAMEQNLQIVDVVEDMAELHECKPAQICLAWLLGAGDFIVPIPGTKRPKYLRENIGAADIRISEFERVKLQRILDHVGVTGERYTIEGMKGLEV
ncbi:aldo/keto reductase [uncultured Sulfitobacter sp.]|uniref:aldo/keto reductase n=1 Tax=uncultured Sulfitobacter sp. TaxID=191468 RepID=UPI00259244B0|nr:aldo/keto reductase [uncultured Sulfitobacter sp.]